MKGTAHYEDFRNGNAPGDRKRRIDEELMTKILNNSVEALQLTVQGAARATERRTYIQENSDLLRRIRLPAR